METTRRRCERKVMEALRTQFRPEFLNRIDEIVIFNSLTRAADHNASWTSSCELLQKRLARAQAAHRADRPAPRSVHRRRRATTRSTARGR